jgi:hypothetical protein
MEQVEDKNNMWEKHRVKALEERETLLEKRINNLVVEKNNLVDQVDELRIQNKRLQKKRDMEEEEIAHKLRMREEENDLHYKQELQKEKEACAENIREVKGEYQDKVEKYLEERIKELRGMYSEILERLPNINLKGKI